MDAGRPPVYPTICQDCSKRRSALANRSVPLNKQQTALLNNCWQDYVQANPNYTINELRIETLIIHESAEQTGGSSDVERFRNRK